MTEFKREDVINKLREGIVRVNFTKKDGEIRDMKCTLASSIIPQDMQPKTESAKITESVIRAYDVDVNGWRSFVVANINSVDSL